MATTINIVPTADAAIGSGGNGSLDPNTNYGTSQYLYVGLQKGLFSGTSYDAFVMRIPLSSIPASARITTAKLYAYGLSGLNPCNVYGISDIPVASRTWTETGVRWSNQPSYGAILANLTVSNNWFSVDITSYIASMYSQGLNADFMIRWNGNACSGYGGFTQFASREYSADTTKRPYLQVIYSPIVSATNMSATPISCTAPCSTVVSVTWTNSGTTSQTFTPGITIDGILYTQTAVTLTAGASTTKSFSVTNLAIGSHVVCPVPN